MSPRTNTGRLLAGLVCACLIAGCTAGAGQAVLATPTPVVAPSAAPATPTPSPTWVPTAAAPSQQTTAPVYDASTAVSIHIENPECVTDRAPTTTHVGGVRQMRDGTRHCRYDAADLRFSGWSDIVVNADCYSEDASKCVRWGTERIPGPDGDWVGSFLGGQLDRGIRFNFEVLLGTGAYAGWTYVAYLNMAALGGEEWVLDGFIYQGPPPPVPPLPSPASD